MSTSLEILDIRDVLKLDVSKKDKFIYLMFNLSRHFKVPDGELTTQYINDFWIGVMDYSIDQIAFGFKLIKETRNPNGKDFMFPSIAQMINAILRAARNSNQVRLPEPIEKPVVRTYKEQQEMRHSAAWRRLYLFSEIYDPEHTIVIRQSEFNKEVSHYRHITTEESDEYQEFLKEPGDSMGDMERKRLAYVKKYMNTEVGQRHKDVSK